LKEKERVLEKLDRAEEELKKELHKKLLV